MQEIAVDKLSNLLRLNQFLLEGFPERLHNTGKNGANKTSQAVFEPQNRKITVLL